MAGVESCEGCSSTRYVIYTITLYAVLLLFDFFVVLWNDPFHVSTPVDVICKGKVISSLSWNRVCRVENYSSCVGKTMWWTCTQTGWSYVGSSEPVDKINNVQQRKDKQSTKTCLAFAGDLKIHFCLLMCLLTVSYSFVFCIAWYRNIKLFVSCRKGGRLILIPFYSRDELSLFNVVAKLITYWFRS